MKRSFVANKIVKIIDAMDKLTQIALDAKKSWQEILKEMEEDKGDKEPDDKKDK